MNLKKEKFPQKQKNYTLRVVPENLGKLRNNITIVVMLLSPVNMPIINIKLARIRSSYSIINLILLARVFLSPEGDVGVSHKIF